MLEKKGQRLEKETRKNNLILENEENNLELLENVIDILNEMSEKSNIDK